MKRGKKVLNNQVLEYIITTLEAKKAKDIKVLKVDDLTLIADYFVICTGTSTTHIKALADELEEKLKDEKKIMLHHKEGYNGARWILMDYSNIIVHIFHSDDRSTYSIEKVWSEAKELFSN
jgi:ribosome-associated protein